MGYNYLWQKTGLQDGISKGTAHNRDSLNPRSYYLVTICSIAALLPLTLLMLSHAGRKGRVILPERKVSSVPALHEAARVWKKQGVRGRTLLLLDRRLNAHRPEPSMQPDEPEAYLYRAVMNTTVRKIYHIIPAAAWAEVSSVLENNPFVTHVDGGFRTATDDGIPVYIMQLVKARWPEESVLVNLNLDVWSSDEAGEILRLVDSGEIRCDLMVVAGSRNASASAGTGTQ